MGLMASEMHAQPAPASRKEASRRPPASRPAGKELRVSAVQMRSTRNLEDNLAKTIRHIRRCAGDGARVVVFPECSVTGYFEDVVRQATSDQLDAAEHRIGEACRDAGVYAIVGMPTRRDGKLFNSAVVISPEGRVLERYHKMQLAEGWPSPGDHLSVFRIDNTWCTIIICHDERYPELVRLPVLAGAQVVFYISHESGIREESKIGPYRAQIQARAVENGVYVVHSNAPAEKDASGSHGQSRIITPGGNIVQEASMFDEEVLTATLELGRATRGNAVNAFRSDVLRSWWQDGVKLVRRID
jgi:predicted amidohydrolase